MTTTPKLDALIKSWSAHATPTKKFGDLLRLAKQLEIEQNQIYIFVRGGCVQGVRSTSPCDVTLVDYDNNENGLEESDFEREQMGVTFEEIEKTTIPAF